MFIGILCLTIIYIINRNLVMLYKQQQAMCYSMYVINRSIELEEQLMLKQ